jgi:iron complex outermembrane recepter protein
MRVSANLFRTNWTDQQVDLTLVPNDPTSGVTVNAGRSALTGAEFELSARLDAQWSAFGSVGLLDTEFKDFVSDLGDFSGLRFPEAPTRTLSIGADWAGGNGWTFGVDARHVGPYLARDLQNAPVDEVGNYTLVNLRLGYERENWSALLFADNLFDRQYFVYRDVIDDFDCCATIGRSRIVGVTVNYRLR